MEKNQAVCAQTGYLRLRASASAFNIRFGCRSSTFTNINTDRHSSICSARGIHKDATDTLERYDRLDPENSEPKSMLASTSPRILGESSSTPARAPL